MLFLHPSAPLCQCTMKKRARLSPARRPVGSFTDMGFGSKRTLYNFPAVFRMFCTVVELFCRVLLTKGSIMKIPDAVPAIHSKETRLAEED